MTHWWEIRGFSATRPEDGKQDTSYDHKGEFQEQVLDALKNGRSKGPRIYHESLSDHKNMTKVRGYSMTPESPDYPDHIKRIKEQVQEILGIDSVAWQDTFYTPLGYDYNDSNSLKGAALVDYTPGTETMEVYLEYKVYVEKRQLR
ncbi:LOW QUALITY PROTEIN: hypothetical protein IFM46972_11330 [Aspergillus udagawae]|uniref:Uncharacterized protein n=1 Tax=Aspergillus udagawae TaxID=91492 RepID=A0A8H3SFV9_9EURO|nr:LOW QUALITY PROTEIN: hypothetical protein IFM46972_11330 [Aspergillus udagawae]